MFKFLLSFLSLLYFFYQCQAKYPTQSLVVKLEPVIEGNDEDIKVIKTTIKDTIQIQEGDTLVIDIQNPPDIVHWGKSSNQVTVDYCFKLHNSLAQPIIVYKVLTGDGGYYMEEMDLPNLIPPESQSSFVIRQIASNRSGTIRKSIRIVLDEGSQKQIGKAYLIFGLMGEQVGEE